MSCMHPCLTDAGAQVCACPFPPASRLSVKRPSQNQTAVHKHVGDNGVA